MPVSDPHDELSVEIPGRLITIETCSCSSCDRSRMSRGLCARRRPSFRESKPTCTEAAPVSREHRRSKTDRLDTELLKRAFLGAASIPS